MTTPTNTAEAILAGDASLRGSAFSNATLSVVAFERKKYACDVSPRGAATTHCDITGLRIDGVPNAPLLAKHKEA